MATGKADGTGGASASVLAKNRAWWVWVDGRKIRDGSCLEEEDGDHGIPRGDPDIDTFGCLSSFIVFLTDMGKWHTAKVTVLLQ